MRKNTLKYEYDTPFLTNDRGTLRIDVQGAKIEYELEIKDNYSYSAGAATMREYLENIENDEFTTHYLRLAGSKWETVIHGLVKFEVYLEKEQEEELPELTMVFLFTGAGTS